MADNAYDLEVTSYKLDRQSLEEAVVDPSTGCQWRHGRGSRGNSPEKS